jgi:hypothetical protein
MNEWAKSQTGSPSRDTFKRKHKDLCQSLYACDLDFVLITKHPTPDIVAVLDYKQAGDGISFAEVVAYNALIQRGIPVYIVTGCAESGRFDIEEYIGGHYREPLTQTRIAYQSTCWQDFERWEKSLRANHYNRFCDKPRKQQSREVSPY